MRSINALTLSHIYINKQVKPGDIVIDATAGRGRDTALLAQLVGENGKVLAFDVQQEALDSTKELLKSKDLYTRTTLILDSHSNMENYAEKETVSCIVFNLGWLPGGDHSIFTQSNTSVKAIEAGLNLLQVGGVMSICIYYGKDCGYKERDTLLEFLPTLDHQKYSVIISDFVNRPNDPPIAVYIKKEG